MSWDGTIWKRKVWMSLACRIVNGEDCQKQTLVFKNTYRKSFHTDFHWKEGQLLEEIRIKKVFGYFQCNLEVFDFFETIFCVFPSNIQSASVNRKTLEIWLNGMQEKGG